MKTERKVSNVSNWFSVVSSTGEHSIMLAMSIDVIKHKNINEAKCGKSLRMSQRKHLGGREESLDLARLWVISAFSSDTLFLSLPLEHRHHLVLMQAPLALTCNRLGGVY